MTNSEGDYVFAGLTKKAVAAPVSKPKKATVHVKRTISNLPGAVQKWPQFAGGNENFLKYLEKMGKALVPSLPNEIKKAYVVVEFIVDTDGTPVNFKVVKGVDEDFDDELITVLEKMPVWEPALLNDKPAPWKIKQGFAIE